MRRIAWLWLFVLLGVFLGVLNLGLLYYKKPFSKEAPLPLAVVQWDRVKIEAAAFKKLKTFVEERNKLLHEEILAKENELRTENEELKRFQALQKVSTDEFSHKKQAFEKKLAEMEQIVQQKKEQLDADVEKGYKTIQQKFKQIIVEIAHKHGTRIVIDAATVLYADSVDLTDAVIVELNKQLKDFTVTNSDG